MTQSTQQSKRRMGPPGSPVWHNILDGAEYILQNEGYGALTSRNIAGRVGIKQQLVYYYFQTMDDLVITLFRRAAEREVEKFKKAIASDQPLREIWAACSHMQDNKLVSEFTALSNRNDELRKDVIAFVKKIRRIQLKAFNDAVQNFSLSSVELSGEALLLIVNALGQTLARDSELDIKEWHAGLQRVVDSVLDAIEPPSA